MFPGPGEHAVIPRGSHCQSSGETRGTRMVKRSKEIRDGRRGGKGNALPLPVTETLAFIKKKGAKLTAKKVQIHYPL